LEALTNCSLGGDERLKKHKVLIVGGFPSTDSKIYGGIVTSCRALLDSSFSLKFDVITLDSTQKSNPIPSLLVRLIFAAKRTTYYLFQLLFSRPKVVILFPAIGASLFEKGVMSWLAFFLRIPVLMFPRGGPLLDQVRESKFTRTWVKLAFGGASKVLCQGPAWKEFAINTLKFSDQDTPIVFNWTATNRLLEIGKKKIKTPTQKPLNILYLGWIEKEKGIYDFLHALKDIKKVNECRISIAGGGSCAEHVKEFVAINGMDGFVNFEGWVGGQELESVLKKSDMLVLPSWAEGFPNAVIEAMASGLAVIVSSVGNVPDILRDGSEALLVPPKDRIALKNSISRLLENDNLRQSISTSGYNFAYENFSIEKAVLKLEKIIVSVVR
jgi:glycosyltransferase involved in cell wall biosynthesis